MLDQLRRPLGRGDGDRAEGRGIAGPAGIDRVVQHHPAADEGADEEIAVIRKLPPAAEDMLSRAGGGGIVLNHDRQAGDPGHAGGDVEIAPGLHFVTGRVDLVEPVPKLGRRRDTDPGHAVALTGGQPPRQGRESLGQKAGDGVRRRIGIGFLALRAQPPGGVDQHQIDTLPADIQPVGQDPVGVQHHRDRGFADLAPLRLPSQQKPVAFQSADDDGNGLGRQVRAPRDLGTGQCAMTQDQRKDQPFVVIAHTGLVRAPQRIANGRDVHIGCLISPHHGGTVAAAY